MTQPDLTWEERQALRGIGLDVGDGAKLRAVSPSETVWSSEDRSYGWHVATRARAYLDAKAERLEARAAELRKLARHEAELARQAAEAIGQPYNELRIDRVGKWHDDRARGARERPERLESCGKKDVFTVTCCSCGSQHKRAGKCSHGLLCRSCRGERKVEVRRDFDASRDIVLAEARRLGTLRSSLPGGRYTEKFLTLTVPHASLDTRERIEAAFDAWRRFVPMLRREFNEHVSNHTPWNVSARVWWYFRRFEWTPGSDGKGHPHFHLWLLSPFVNQARLHVLWQRALRASVLRDGRRAYAPSDVDTVLTPDVRVANQHVSRELIKYILKDWHDGAEVSPDLFAEVFAAVDDRRLTQASRGFVGLGKKPRFCRECELFAPAWVEVRPALAGELDEIRRERARGPPGGSVGPTVATIVA